MSKQRRRGYHHYLRVNSDAAVCAPSSRFSRPEEAEIESAPLCCMLTPSFVCACVGVAVTAAAESADMHSEQLLERLLAGQSSVEDFLDEYPKARAVYHTREAKRADMEPKLKALGHVA
eukprot:9124895-Pyramimonas_sp.AAC.1